MKHLLSPIGRVAFPRLFKAAPVVEGGKPRLSVTLVYGTDINIAGFQKDVADFVEREAPKKWPHWFASGGKGLPTKFKFPFRSGEEREGKEGFCDTDTFVEAWRYEDKGPVPVVDQKRNPVIESDIYAGCSGRFHYRPFLYENSGNVGVSLSLEAFQKAGDGDPIGFKQANPDECFEDIEEDTAALLD